MRNKPDPDALPEPTVKRELPPIPHFTFNPQGIPDDPRQPAAIAAPTEPDQPKHTPGETWSGKDAGLLPQFHNIQFRAMHPDEVEQLRNAPPKSNRLRWPFDDLEVGQEMALDGSRSSRMAQSALAAWNRRNPGKRLVYRKTGMGRRVVSRIL